MHRRLGFQLDDGELVDDPIGTNMEPFQLLEHRGTESTEISAIRGGWPNTVWPHCDTKASGAAVRGEAVGRGATRHRPFGRRGRGVASQPVEDATREDACGSGRSLSNYFMRLTSAAEMSRRLRRACSKAFRCCRRARLLCCGCASTMTGSCHVDRPVLTGTRASKCRAEIGKRRASKTRAEQDCACPLCSSQENQQPQDHPRRLFLTRTRRIGDNGSTWRPCYLALTGEEIVLAHRILFKPHEYSELTETEHQLLTEGYQRAIDALYRNVTPKGFSACSLADNLVYGTDANYRSVWARDGAMTVIWSLDLDHEPIRECQANTLRTLFSHQSPNGQIPANVSIDTDIADYSGVGGIASIDSGLWVIIAMFRYANETADWSIVDEHRSDLQRAMDWLGAHDSNNCGLLEIPEAGDWTDLFARSYHILYDEVLWYRCLVCYASILEHFGEEGRATDYRKWSAHVKKMINLKFWPSTTALANDQHDFARKQSFLGDARYLLAQLSPFGFSWRCDVYANLLAYLMYDLVTHEQAMMTFRFLWGVGINEPAPVHNLYPPVYAGDPEWRDYFTVNLLNLPNHYHNGGIWPFIGGLWVRYLHKLGMKELARREMVKLALLCRNGIERPWEFNEWYHGITGRPMGKMLQAWSAASFIQACHDLSLDSGKTIEHE